MRSSRLLALPAAVLLMATPACDRGLTEVNANPNAPETVPLQNLLAQALITGIGGSWGTDGLSTGKYLLDLWGQHLAAPTYPEEERYNPRDSQVQSMWDHIYINPLADLQELSRAATAQQNANLLAVSETFKQFLFHHLTDIYGDIPYSEALQAPEIVYPKYDTQEQVYRGMLAALTTASGQMNSTITRAGFAQGDLLFAGNMERWYRFNNSLRMRMAMRLSNVLPEDARSEFEKAYRAGGLQSNADNARFVWSANPPNQNPWHPNYVRLGRRDQVVSAALVTRLQAWNDPRLPIFAQPGADGQFRGLPNGLTVGESGFSEPAFSRPGTRFVEAQRPSVLINYAEVLFLQAEAAARGWIPGDPAALYRAAIRASMEEHGVATGEIDTYLAQPVVAYAGLPSIWTQKWVALFLVGTQAWAEVRRTGYPQLTPAIGDRIATRVFYPPQEKLYNPQNYVSTTLFTPMWWQGK